MPGRPGFFFGLTDRGPNADAPDGNKSEMVLGFTPQIEIGEFRLVNSKAELIKTVTLKGPRSLGGVNYSGRPPHDTTEVIDDVAATNATPANRNVTPQPVARDPYGYDSEGLVALPDGTFWVSDEYGPYFTHFDANGFEIGRLTPHQNIHKVIGYLLTDLANRLKNTVDLHTYQARQYLYLLDNPATTGDANSEITALSDTKFIIDERDGAFEPLASKTLYEADINGATDITGLTIDGKSPEAFVGTADTNAALAALTKAGVQVAQKQPYLQIGTLLSQLDPPGALLGHDKVEGVATTDAGKTLYLSNDDDFAIDTIAVDPDGT